MKSIAKLIRTVVFLFIFLFVCGEVFKWGMERVYVGPDEALIVINKFGAPLPADRVVAPRITDTQRTQYKGVQEDVRGPGRYFLNPIEYDWKIVPQIQIAAGNPEQWDWDTDGKLKVADSAPMIGLVSKKEGKTPDSDQAVVDPEYRGIQREVLTPGMYKINPQQYEVTIIPAVVVPPGSVGVVTRLTGDVGKVANATLTEIRAAATTGPSTNPDPNADNAPNRLVVGPTDRGILKDVLQPGIYYINPKLAMVTIVPVGYDQITLDHHDNTAIRFYSSDGYQVEADFTVVWGRTPTEAPHIVANIGNVDRVRANVIEPAMKAACQNEGARYTAKELIQGTTRSKFQDALSASLEEQVSSRNVHVLLALIRNISVQDNAGNDATGGLLASIQQANIEVENQLTNEQKTETAAVNASLDQAKKLVVVAQQTVASDTTVKVANVIADAQKTAAETDAQRDLDVATIKAQIAALDAQRTLILGKAQADVTRLKNEADAKGAKMMVDAFGTPQAYNLYIFAKNFEPTDMRMIFAGPGTFWTDLKSFQEVGAVKMIKQADDDKK